jgi:septal ring factor EnvC (AmiA/AmiB activator)
MTQYQKALAVLVVAVLGIWGCAQGPAGSASADKMKNLENKLSRVEADFKAAATARDQFKKKLVDAENLTVQMRQELDAIQKEREELRTLVKTRTTERDNLSNQFEAFRKNLKDLIGQTEAALAKPANPPITTVSEAKTPNF